jgi:hypothetical protein
MVLDMVSVFVYLLSRSFYAVDPVYPQDVLDGFDDLLKLWRYSTRKMFE